MRHPRHDYRREQDVAHAQQEDRAQVCAHVAIRREQRGAVQQRRDEDQKHELWVELNRGQAREQRREQPADEKHRGRGHRQAPRGQRQEGDTHEQGEDGLEMMHRV